MDETRRLLERDEDPADPRAWRTRIYLCRERVRMGELELVGESRKHLVVRELVPLACPDSTFELRGWRLRVLSPGVYQTTPIEGRVQSGREPTLADWRATGNTWFVPLDPPQEHSDIVSSMKELGLGYFGPRDSYFMRADGKRESARLQPRGSAIKAQAPFIPVKMIVPGQSFRRI